MKNGLEEKIIMIKIMAVNAGSSSLKFQLLEMPEENVITSGVIEKIGQKESIYTIKYNGTKRETNPVVKDHAEAVDILLHDLIELKILNSLDEIKGVGHRVVQGGEYFKDSALLGENEIQKIAELADLAPLHNPAHVVGIRAFQKALPDVPAVAVFDTTFHQTMAKEAYLYATPYEWYEKYGVRKYGAHGTSHRYVSERIANLCGLDYNNSKIIVLHIGNGASISAVKNGKCVDTSMGLTPLGGIPMGTRSGDLDPAVLEFMYKKEGLSITEEIQMLNKKSGYLGMSGVGSDARDLTKGMREGNERCKDAFDVQAKRIVDFIASYYVYMGGCDAIAFTAGVGENVAHLRKNIIDRLACLGVKLDEQLNDTFSDERRISTLDSKIAVWIVPTNEEVMIARDTIRLGNIK